jgi:hypothetical protein
MLVLILANVLPVVLHVLHVVFCVRHVLVAHPVMDVAMVSSPPVGRDYHSALDIFCVFGCQPLMRHGNL